MTSSSPVPTVAGVEQRRLLRTAVPGPHSQKLHERRRESVSDAFGIVLPVFVERAAGGIIVDVDGNQLVDLASGIAVTSVGASHPRVVERVSEQVARFTHTCFMVTEYEEYVALCEALARITPGDHDKRAALFSTGAEAVENAVKIARAATGRPAVVTLGHAYHGRTLLTMSMTAKNVPYKNDFGPFAPEVYRVPSPYPYRWLTGPERAADEAFDALVETVTTQLGAHHVAAIVVEPVQGEGGFIPMPEGYLPKVAEFARQNGIVLIADEIQSGMGRTGRMFAVEHDGVVPDLVTVAKALGGGLPISAVVGRAELMNAVPAGGLGGTYAGNPVACAAALGAIEAIETEGLVERAARIEQLALPRLQALVGPDSVVGDARGRGAMLAVEIVQPGTRTPAPDLAKAISGACHADGVLTLVCGTFGNVVRMLPPLVIGDDLLADALDVVEAAVRSVS
jgi:4-aminobutyrate aminotransferase/(S)-3-amino-2-methylpropionate transaminase